MRIRLILDPYSGRGKGKRFLPHIKKILRKGNILDLSLTKGPGDAFLSAHEAARKDYDVIVAGGGDGTLNETINGILRVRRDLPLGFIPLGMSNTAACAQDMGFPLDPLKACEIILENKIKKIDLGKVTKPVPRYFLSMTDYGFPAAVVHKVESRFKTGLFKLKIFLGRFLYWRHAYPEFFKYKFPRIDVKMDNVISEGSTVIVSNNGCYMGNFKIASQAKIDDGYLDVCIFKSKKRLDWHRYLYGFLFNKLHAFPDVEYYRAKKVSISSSEEVPGAIDGEPFGFAPVEIEVAPQILPVIVP
jgi:YegS/Rv2252/BmrU family lipid kinase